MSTIMSIIMLETVPRMIHPVITLVINTFSTLEIHELHTWHSAEYTAADLTQECYQETRVQSTEIQSHHIQYLKW